MAMKTYDCGQKMRIMIGCRYPNMTEIAADDKIALNFVFPCENAVFYSWNKDTYSNDRTNICTGYNTSDEN